MKRKYLQKILTVTAITLSLTIYGCGKAEEGNASGVWEESDTAALDRQIDGTESSFGEDKAPEAENEAYEDTKMEEEDENGTGEVETEEEIAAERESSTGEETPTEKRTTAKGEWQTIEGSVETIGEGNFTINQIFTEDMEDGSQIAVANMEDKTLVTVYYTEETEFIVRTTTDGLTSTDRPGTEGELPSASTVILSGNWNGEGFQAEQVVIFVVDM